MKKKGENTHKVQEILFDLESESGFVSDILEIRKKYKIPDNGFEDISKGLFFGSETNNNGFDKNIQELIKIYKIPTFFYGFLSNYILYGHNFPEFFFTNKELCEIDIFSPIHPSPIDKFWSESGTPFVRMYISDTASKQDVIDFIDANWTPEIKRLLDDQRGKPKKRVRKKDKRDLHKTVGILYNMPIKELRQLTNEKFTGGYLREQIIKEIIKGKFNENLSIFTIRRVGTEYKIKERTQSNHPH